METSTSVALDTNSGGGMLLKVASFRKDTAWGVHQRGMWLAAWRHSLFQNTGLHKPCRKQASTNFADPAESRQKPILYTLHGPNSDFTHKRPSALFCVVQPLTCFTHKGPSALSCVVQPLTCFTRKGPSALFCVVQPLTCFRGNVARKPA